ncbi:MAG TPA: A/G-specific adenine glycosylase, partial [Cryomorphaceae bacterium]|nr:A/G-specific adenine glycosylase [Cryomorphaceae bacterium]
MDIQTALIEWFDRSARTLPWRSYSNPYAIWLSEVILQQTRVAQGRAYWEKFMTEFPTLQSLAEAPSEKVMGLWAGLGYYSRARNLHATAKIIAELGDFPNNAKDLQSLPGIGPYTAAAIASI